MEGQTHKDKSQTKSETYLNYQQQLAAEIGESEKILKARKQLHINEKDPLNLLLCDIGMYFGEKQGPKLSEDTYNVHSVIPADDKDRLHFSQLFSEMRKSNVFTAKELKLDVKTSRGVAAVMGMAIGDALGACTEFQPFQKQGFGLITSSFYDIHKAVLAKTISPRSGKIGIWTDDASMGLCMADSTLLTDYHFNPKHLRYMFTMWLEHGLNNGGRPYSIGLGGNISISMYEFNDIQQNFTREGDRFNNGNGSLMRLAPIPVAYSDNLQKGVFYSGLQSLTTHNGVEAQECSRLMGTIIIKLINRGDKDGKATLLQVCDSFKSPVKSVQFLAKGQMESKEYYEEQYQSNPKFKLFNKTREDRNWNWRDKDHMYAKSRLDNMPGYIGSYCMDGLCMALHTVLFSNSFVEVVAKNADMGGDCDTVGSIAGQIAGALYGCDDGMMRLYSEMQDFKSQRYDVFLKAFKLSCKKKLDLKVVEQEEGKLKK